MRDIQLASGVHQKTISSMENPEQTISPLLANIEKLATSYRLSVRSLLALDLTDSGADPNTFSTWIDCFSGLSTFQQSLLISMAKEFQAGSWDDSSVQ